MIKFKHWACKPHFRHYSNGRIAIELHDMHPKLHDTSLVAIATINIPDYDLLPGHVLIKNWSENAGVYQALVEAGYIHSTTRLVPTGYVQALDAKLTDKSLRLLAAAAPSVEHIIYESEQENS